MAKDPLLVLPVDCTMGVDCYIHDYVDRDPGTGVLDFGCGSLTRNDHTGTDFAVLTHAARHRGVNVIAASPGRVVWVNDGMDDIASTAPNAPDITGKSCGNGVAIRHGGGWVTRYCHLKQGSIAVANGQRVRLRTVLGQVGMSGMSNYPHIHFTVTKLGQVVDPFAPDMQANCTSTPTKTLWQTPMPYTTAGWLRAGFAPTPPSRAEVDDGIDGHPRLSRDLAVFGAWGHFYGVRKDDILRTTWVHPDGTEEITSLTAGIDNQRNVRWVSKVGGSDGFAPGPHSVRFELERGGKILDQITSSTVVD
ncbi:MAG: M23 family metallopeptidase [Planktomarina sp.]